MSIRSALAPFTHGKSWVLLAIGALTVIAGIFVGGESFEAIRSVQTFYQVEIKGLKLAGEMAFQIQESRRILIYSLTTEDPNEQVAYIEQAREAADSVERLRQLLQASRLDAASCRTLEDFSRNWNEYLRIRDQVIASILLGDKKPALNLDFSQAHPAFERAKTSLTVLETALDRSASDRLGNVTRALYRSLGEIVLLLAAMLIFLKTVGSSLERRRTVEALRKVNSELEETKRNLEDHELRLRTLFNNVLDAIITIDVRGAIESANHAAGVIFGCPAGELVGTEFENYVPGFRQRLQDSGARSDMNEGFRSWPPIEVVGKRMAGGEMLVDISSSEFLDHNRKEILTAVIRDVTERRQLERQLAQAQKLESIGQLAAGIAHEINTPIQYIGDNAVFLETAFRDYLASHKSADGEEAEEMSYYTAEIPKALEQMNQGIGHVARIVRAMKEFSHPGRAEKVPTDINRAIENTILVSRNEWRYCADLTTDLDPDLPEVFCIGGDFNQVMLNLIVNAAHAIAAVGDGKDRKGAIHITTRQVNDGAEIRITDTGTGIPEAIQTKIFDPFFTTKEVGKGTGQGLAIAHSMIVQKHQGEITFETKMGVGTTFCIQLPLNPEDEEAGETPHAAGSRV